MRDTRKKVITLAVTMVLATSMVTFAGCDNDYYKLDKPLTYQSSSEKAESNGGFAVQKGEYTYFINGIEEYSASNKYGEVKKGALMRISNTDLSAKRYDKAETVVPMLFVAQNFNAGIYIYGDYVYYATPTTDKNKQGEVENTWIDFKSAKLDGTKVMKDYYFRLSANSANYRFVEDAQGTVYCLYEENSMLKSYNTATKKTTVLVKNATSSFYYDLSDPTNPDVYYTMDVINNYDTDNPDDFKQSYNQLYKVSAFASVSNVNATNASYTVKGGKTYDFDASFLKDKNKEAKENKEDELYDLSDYTTYPYVNLGTLVLDGISKTDEKTQFNSDTTSTSLLQYKYTIVDYENDGLYIQRNPVVGTANTNVYYVASDAVASNTWDSVTANEDLTVASSSTTFATQNAIFYTTADTSELAYIYLSNVDIVRTVRHADGTETDVTLVKNAGSSATVWTIEGDYLYYYNNSDGDGANLYRVKYNGLESDYLLGVFEPACEYRAEIISGIEFNKSWYKPEIVGNTLLYANETAFGHNSYNYVYATELPTTQAQLRDRNKQYDAVQEKIDEYSDNQDLQDLMTYYFRTGETDLYEAVKSLYTDVDGGEQDQFEEFKALFKTDAGEDRLYLYNHFYQMLGDYKVGDEEAIKEDWANTLKQETATEEDKGLPTWAIILIVVGSVLVVAGGVVVTFIILKKKKEKAEKEEATVNAYKRVIDTTDDKTIDVYADEQAEETTETQTEESAEGLEE